MRAVLSVCLRPLGVAPFLLAALLFALGSAFNPPAEAIDIEHPADVAPEDAEPQIEDELIEPEDFDPDALMRPDSKAGGWDAPPPQSTEDSKQDKLAPLSEDQPLPTSCDVVQELCAEMLDAMFDLAE